MKLMQISRYLWLFYTKMYLRIHYINRIKVYLKVGRPACNQVANSRPKSVILGTNSWRYLSEMRNSPFSIGDTIAKATKIYFSRSIFKNNYYLFLVFEKVLRKGNSPCYSYIYILPNIFLFSTKIISAFAKVPSS